MFQTDFDLLVFRFIGSNSVTDTDQFSLKRELQWAEWRWFIFVFDFKWFNFTSRFEHALHTMNALVR